MQLLLRATRALQELNMTYVAPSTFSRVCVLTRIAFGFYSSLCHVLLVPSLHTRTTIHTVTTISIGLLTIIQSERKYLLLRPLLRQVILL